MPRKKTLAEFVANARKVHGDKYDYSKAVYLGTHTKLCIVCPKHGDFWQEPNNHISGRSICPKCSYEQLAELNRSNNDAFITKARTVHGDKYDYSQVEYKHNEKKVRIICPEHGPFLQTPHNHLNGAGCPKCANMYSPTTEEFINASKAIFGEKYDYSKTVYRSSKTKVCIICPEHGEFWVTPNNHLTHKIGCSRCTGYYDLTLEEFIEEANKRFNNQYDYSRVVWKGFQKKVEIVCPEHGVFIQTPMAHKVHYRGNKNKVCIICPEHGEFWQDTTGHLAGRGCPKCAGVYMDTPLFIEKATIVHNNKYDYSLVDYKGNLEKVKIICPKHGVFEQVATYHLAGNGCPACSESHMEMDIRRFLKRNHLKFESEKTFDWLVYEGKMFLDFFLPDYGIAIECQGGQHFEAVEYFGGDEMFERTKQRDSLKKELCEEHGIRVLYFSNLGIDYPYPVFEDLNALLQAIKDSDKADPTLWKDPELPFVLHPS